MRYRAISLENDQRRAHFAYFSTMQNPYVGLTAEVEAGAILGACHRNGWPFSLAMVWCTGRAANAVPALRQRILNGGVVEFDRCDTSHTVLRPDGSYAYCTLDPMWPFAEFLPAAKRRQAEAIANGGIDDGRKRLACCSSRRSHGCIIRRSHSRRPSPPTAIRASRGVNMRCATDGSACRSRCWSTTRWPTDCTSRTFSRRCGRRWMRWQNNKARL